MSVSISQYIDALENPAGRFRTLGGIYPLRNTDGTPSLRAHRRYVDFDILAPSGRAVLRAPLGSEHSLCEMRILAARLARMRSPYLLPFEFREAEMTVFDSSMNPKQIDVCVQVLPPHSSLEEFLQQQSASGSTAQIERIIPQLTELVFWAHRNSIGLTPSAVIVTQSGNGPAVRMVSIPKIDLSSQVIAATLATLLMPHSYAQFGRRILLHPRAMAESAGIISAALRGTAYEEIAAMASGCDRASLDAILGHVGAYTHEDFCNMGKLLAANPAPALQPICDAAQHEAPDIFSHYYWTDRTGEDIVCAMDSDGWKYVDAQGRPVFPQTFRYAMPFREGRAEVETETGKGLIDRQGRYVLPPEYEEVSWDEYHGVAVVMRYGKWSLKNRDGKPVGREHFDYLGDFSEGLDVAMRDGKWGFVNLSGQVVVPLKYDDASSFSDGAARVSENGREFTIDRSGRQTDSKGSGDFHGKG